MAHWEYLNVLERGVEVWNRRKEGLARERADLSGAFLGGMDLAGADFRWANLIEADLGGANLSGADFREADLVGAKLGAAELRGANLGQADLSRADLGRADLGQADLSSTNLSSADLSVGFIDPVPLISPRLAPPPDELASRHFNDWMLAFMGSAG